jgi:hypothetical protein
VFVLKMLSLTVLSGVAVGLGFLVVRLAGSTSPIVFMVTTVTAMMIEAVAFLPVLALAFRQFDPSLNTPV